MREHGGEGWKGGAVRVAGETFGVEEVREKDGWMGEDDDVSTRTPSWARPPRVRVNDSRGIGKR